MEVDAVIEAVYAQLHQQGCNDEPPNVPFAILTQWTENFDALRAIGSGGFGDVFRGEFTDSTRRQYGAVAVKRVNQYCSARAASFSSKVSKTALWHP